MSEKCAAFSFSLLNIVVGGNNVLVLYEVWRDSGPPGLWKG